MDRRSRLSVAREQFLRVPEASQQLTPSVEPVTLERKWLTMLDTPPSDPAQVHTTSATTTTATTTTSSTTEPPFQTSTAAVAVTAPSTSATTAPKISGGTAAATTAGAATAAAAAAAASRPLAEQHAATSETRASSTVTSGVETSTIVGRKRPIGEESPVIILTQPEDDDVTPREATSERPDSDARSTRNQQQQEPTTIFLARKQEEARNQLSTGESTKERGRDLERRGGRPGVQPSDVSPKRDVGDVMQFFREQEKSLQASFLSLPKTGHKKPRSSSPKLTHAAGLEHLDNLIRLMEQLTSLKDENLRLRKRCDYLESTKVLLQAKRDLSFESSSSSSGFMTLATKHKHHHHQHHEKPPRTSSQDPGGEVEPGTRVTRPRIASAEELEYLKLIDSASDQRPKRTKSGMHKRSFSTGSLEVPSEMSPEVSGMESRKRMKSKTGRSIFSKSSASKQKTKASKWARVKKVLTGQKLYEDLGTTIRSIRDLGRSSHVRYSASGMVDLPRAASPHAGVSGRDQLLLEAGPGSDIEMSRAPLALTSESLKSRDLEEADSDLTSDIWMGPPDWWEEYESRKESGTSTNSEVSSVIEVTTMYLGTSKEVTTTALVPAAAAPASSGDNYLTVDKALPRRQSSPSLSMKEAAEEDDVLDELAATAETGRSLHKSASCKSADLNLPKSADFHGGADGRQSKKSHKTAWGRVKDIIHTRKDSVKKRPKREKSGVDSEETSEIDMETIAEEHWRAEMFGESMLGRSTPKTSPIVIRQQTGKGASGSPPAQGAGAYPKSPPARTSSYHGGTSAGAVDVAALLAGSMSDDFTRKMQQWESMRSKKASFRVKCFLDQPFKVAHQELIVEDQELVVGDKKLVVEDQQFKVEDQDTSETPEESNTSMEVLGAPTINVEEIQRRMTESFSRKMQEWERLKYKSSPASARDTSPEMERKMSKTRKDERQKSKRSREEKEKEKWERQRERDMQKVEREQIKLEKEKMRIEKERLRALEREAKLEKLKGRLSQSEGDSSFKNPVLSPLAEYKVTSEFARKLHEWELKKGLSHDVSNSIYLEAQKMSLQFRKEDRLEATAKPDQQKSPQEGSRAEGGRKALPPPPLTLQPYWDSPDDTSPVERYSEASVGDDETSTSITEEFMTRSHIATLERANAQLLENLQQKELEYSAVQEEVQKVNDKLAKVRHEHAEEMARFHRELAKGSFSGPVKLEVGDLETTMGDLEEKIKLMENFGEKLAMSMESAAVGKWQSIEGEETVHTQLVELVDQMRTMLVQATKSEEHSQKAMALTNFETLYSQAMKLQVQMNNLRLSHLERNREIMGIKRQLLLQEVNNLLLQADITRRETELYQFQEAKRFASLKRWNTFSGAERQRPQALMEVSSATPVKSVIQREPRFHPPEGPRVNIPYIAEEMTMISAASSSLSAPASPLVMTVAGSPPPAPSAMTTLGSPTSSAPTAAGQPHSRSGAPSEQSTDHLERYLLTPPLVRPSRPRSPVAPRWYPERRSEGQRKPDRDSQTSVVMSRSVTQLQPRAGAGASPTRTQPRVGASASPTRTQPRVGDDISLEKDTPTSPSNEANRRSVSGISSRPDDVTTSARRELNTICDSAPLHREIEELRRAKTKVEKGSHTLMRKAREGPSPDPSPGEGPRLSLCKESPNLTIPQQQGLDVSNVSRADAAPIIDDDKFPAQSVMACTVPQHVVEQAQLNTDSNLGAVGGYSLPPLAASSARRDLPPISDQSKSVSKPARSPLSKHKLLRRQKEDTTIEDYRAISPKGSPIAARGKPPLPRQAAQVKHSPSASPASEKGPRSKSLGDMDRGNAESQISSKPLQDAINRFEKRATVCETEDRPIELRKTPSPTLHLPRVGLVSRVRRLKPAAELLEESQRYRSGHSIYATRILQRYLTKEESKPDPSKTAQNKENVSGTYVHAIVRRLSRDNTPTRSNASSRTNSELSLKRTDSPRAQSEFVSQIVRKLSSSSTTDAHRSPAPFKDLTNEGRVKKLAQSFTGHPTGDSPERTLSDSDIDKQLDTPGMAKAQHRKSCEVAMVLSMSASPTSEGSYQMISSMSSGSEQSSVAVPTNHQSLPTLAAHTSAEEAARGRAATYCVSETEKQKALEEAASPETPTTSRTGRTMTTGKKTSKSKEKSGKSGLERGEASTSPTSLSPERRGKMGTVGVLCKQSISFDLGVSLYSQKSESGEGKSRQARSWDPSESLKAEAAAAAASGRESEVSSERATTSRASSPTVLGATSMRPESTSSQGEMAPGSPTSDEKKKRRFLDSSWLQKSKKFFKVSK
ncbi:unnamed protein product [Lymnaea stagnalis]|uniref:Uncharacterized protein n=1 Tax=Lymnaea stagnalis TaxID=6523 RepID=A0AAV2I3M5_LYMST